MLSFMGFIFRESIISEFYLERERVLEIYIVSEHKILSLILVFTTLPLI